MSVSVSHLFSFFFLWHWRWYSAIYLMPMISDYRIIAEAYHFSLLLFFCYSSFLFIRYQPFILGSFVAKILMQKKNYSSIVSVCVRVVVAFSLSWYWIWTFHMECLLGVCFILYCVCIGRKIWSRTANSIDNVNQMMPGRSNNELNWNWFSLLFLSNEDRTWH